MLGRLQAGWNNGKRWRILWISAFLLTLMAWGSLFGYIYYVQHHSFAPLDKITTQVIGDPKNPSGSKTEVTVEGQQFLAYVVHVSKTSFNPSLPVTWSRCSHSRSVVRVKVETQWTEVIPPGENISTGSVVETRVPGCSSQPNNEIVPVDVLIRAAQLDAKGEDTSLWQIEGIDIPLERDGTEGTSQNWVTQNFVVQYDR